jgi:acetyltransferase-like isoleucine patch superfamily enzyme
MKITFHDIILGSVVTAVCLSAGAGLAWAVHLLVHLSHGFQAIVLIAAFFGGFILGTFIILWLLRLLWPLREGLLPLAADSQSLVWKLMGYVYVTHLWPLINANLVPVNLRGPAFSLLGARIGKSVMVGGKILDPSLVEIGDYSMLGEDCLLTAHAVEGDRVDLGRIVVGRNVTVGVKAVVLPDVRIGDNAIVAAGAVVKKGARIGPGEIWGGVPARKIGEVERGSDRVTE